MKTYILCLANSKKYGERCIAGVVMQPDGKGQFFPVRHQGAPRWIRPVSDGLHGQVPARLAEGVSVGDILSINSIKACPEGYQSENVYFEKKSLKIVRKAVLTERHLEQLAENDGRYIFNNPRTYLTGEEIQNMNRSLILIKAEKIKPFFSTPYNTRPRIKILYKKNWYNFPLTDVNFIDRMHGEPLLAAEREGAFLTISLGVPFEGKYWKLAAGIVIDEGGPH